MNASGSVGRFACGAVALVLAAGTVLACKSVFDEAFCLSDMLDATSDKYTLAELEHLEFAAVQHVQLTRIPERLIRFRAGLLQVMLVHASVLKSAQRKSGKGRAAMQKEMADAKREWGNEKERNAIALGKAEGGLKAEKEETARLTTKERELQQQAEA